MSLPVYVINRAVDRDRLRAFAAAAAVHGVIPTRIDAVDAAAEGAFAGAAPLLPATFWERPSIKPGAFACFLSHRRAWRAVADGAAPWALVCEDDAVLRAGASEIAALAAAAPPGARVIQCGERMLAWRDAALGAGGFTPLAALAAALGVLSAGAATRAPGAEATLLTPGGARDLLALTARDGACAGVDWLLLFRCWDGRGDVVPRPELESLRRMLGAEAPRLAALVAPAALAGLSGAPSVVRHRVRRPIEDLRAEC
jgi:GR25 family glycosyltransferase involved in LPS biosynthesis